MLDFRHRRAYFLASYDRSELVRENQEPACPNPGAAPETLCFFVWPGRCMDEEIDFGWIGRAKLEVLFPAFCTRHSVDRRTQPRVTRPCPYVINMFTRHDAVSVSGTIRRQSVLGSGY
jgi:hypothetical protein